MNDNIQEEQWRVIEECPDYMVSNMGEVWSIKTETILSPGNNGTGYMFVNLWSDDGVHREYVHRLVVKAFIGEIAEGLQVNHINHNKADNWLRNLEIVSQSRNNYDRTKSGRYTFEFVESLPEDARPFTSYKKHKFNMYYVSQGQVFQFIRENRYRVLVVRRYRYDCYNLKDINNKDVQVPITIFN